MVVDSYFQYIPSSGECIEVNPLNHCIPTKNCSFTSHDECIEVCKKDKKSMVDCASTQYGCCGDGVTVRSEGGCPGECM